MKTYKQRKPDALRFYRQGKARAKRASNAKQKFAKGTRVHIAKDLGPGMSHFESDLNATVQHSYAQAYGGNDFKSYSLDVDGIGEVAWYDESQLTKI